MVYNIRSQICCNGNVASRWYSYAECCGSEVYDADSYLCCDGIVNHKSYSASACCGSEVYKTRSQTCCHGNVSNRRYSYADCCGSQVYDAGSDICCDGVVKDRPYSHMLWSRGLQREVIYLLWWRPRDHRTWQHMLKDKYVATQILDTVNSGPIQWPLHGYACF